MKAIDAFNSSTSNGLEIAIIGMSCRFPGAKDVDSAWHNLRNGVESVSFFSDEELLSSGINPALLSKPNYVKANAVLPDIEMFDASFFGISPREANIIDPQHRLFLECAWESMESAGYDPETNESSIGVYAGVGMNTYLLKNLYPNLDTLELSLGNFQLMIANDKDFMPTRVSYKLNLKGPSVNVQTACSTSLVAVHMACQSLLNGECDMALAGGVSVRVPQKAGYFYHQGMILSPDGHCRAFDARAQGTVVGNGVGIVVLKRLADAIADGDCIHAIIKGSAINNDGSQKVGYTAPSVDGQTAVISEAQAIAGIEAETITYIEAHGTGTALGDLIEMEALTQAFRASTQKKGFCAIGSVKTNIGHLDAASGVAGLIKTVLALKHKLLPPSLHFEQPNPQIDFANSPFYVNTTLSEWKTDGTPRRAGVSSFGIGGTNAHVILEEAPALVPVAAKVERSQHILALSAKSEKALGELAQSYADFLASHRSASLADICFTASTGRSHFDHRLAVVAESHMQLQEALSAFATGRETTGLVSSKGCTKKYTKIAFLFTGQGSEYLGMGRQIYETQPTFRQTFDRCNEILRPYLKESLLQVLYPEPGKTSLLDQTAYTQPALFALEYALVQLWKSWGVEPTAVMGHSVGEYVAACVAGVFSLEDGLKLIAERARLMQSLPQEGEMVAEFRRVAATVTYAAPQVDIISNVTGEQLTAEAINPEYWCRHLRSSVQFTASLQKLHTSGYEVFVEIGPKPTLLGMGRYCLPEVEGVWLPSLCQGQEDWQLLQSLGELYVRGMPVNWSGFDRDYVRRRVNLPTYPWQRQRYWVETAEVNHHKTQLPSSNDSLIRAPLAPDTLGDRQQLLQSYLLAEVAKLLQIPVAKLDVQQSLNSLGMDSLMGLELKNRLEADLEVEVPIADLIEAASVEFFITQMLVKMELADSNSTENPLLIDKVVSDEIESDLPRELSSNVDELSDEEVDYLLKQVLN